MKSYLKLLFLITLSFISCDDQTQTEDDFNLGIVEQKLMDYDSLIKYKLDEDVDIKDIIKYGDYYVIAQNTSISMLDEDFNLIKSQETGIVTDLMIYQDTLYVSSFQGIYRINDLIIEHVYQENQVLDLEIDNLNRLILLRTGLQQAELVIYQFVESNNTVEPIHLFNEPALDEISYIPHKISSLDGDKIMTVSTSYEIATIKEGSFINVEKPNFTANNLGWNNPYDQFKKLKNTLHFQFRDSSPPVSGHIKSLYRYENDSWHEVYKFDNESHLTNDTKYEIIKNEASFIDFLWLDEYYYCLAVNGIMKFNETEQDFLVIRDPNLIDESGNYITVNRIIEINSSEILLTSGNRIFKILI